MFESNEEWVVMLRRLISRLEDRTAMNIRSAEAPGKTFEEQIASRARADAYRTAIEDAKLIFEQK